MLVNVAIGGALIVATTIVHATAMSLLLSHLRRTHAEVWGMRSSMTRVLLVCLAVLFLTFASLIEASIWAATYLAVGAISELEPAVYFSLTTFTSLGYGDVVAPPAWRLLAAIEAANGIVMFGWTTALIFFIVQRLYLTRQSKD